MNGGLLLLLNAFVNMFDDRVSRVTGRVTRFGATFDHGLDRYAEYFMAFGLWSFWGGRKGAPSYKKLIIANLCRG